VITNKDKLKLSGFTGIKEVGENLDDRIDEIHGMSDRHVGSLERVAGKLSSITSTTSSIWSITQLRFGHFTPIINTTATNSEFQIEYVQPDWGDLDLDFDWMRIPRVQEDNYVNHYPDDATEEEEKRDEIVEYYNKPNVPSRHPTYPPEGWMAGSPVPGLLATPDVININNWNYDEIQTSIIDNINVVTGVHEDCFLLPVLVQINPTREWFSISSAHWWTACHTGSFVWLMSNETDLSPSYIAALNFSIGACLSGSIEYWWSRVVEEETNFIVTIYKLNSWRCDLHDWEEYVRTDSAGFMIKEEITVNVIKCNLKITVPAYYVTRAVAFSITIECSDTGYTPRGPLSAVLSSNTDGDDVLTPSVIPEVGWVNGKITINNCTITNGHGYNDSTRITITAQGDVMTATSDIIYINPHVGEFWEIYNISPSWYGVTYVRWDGGGNPNRWHLDTGGHFAIIAWSAPNAWILTRDDSPTIKSYKYSTYSSTPVGTYGGWGGTFVLTADETSSWWYR